MSPYRKILILLCAFTVFTSNALCAGDAAPRVMLETQAGNIEIEVYPDKAPLSAGDFLTYVDRGIYQGGTFWRVVRLDNDRGSPKIEIIEGGVLDPDKILPPIAHETTEQSGILHTDGVVSLGRYEPGTGSAADFFICIGDQPGLDFGATRNADKLGFAAFGRVIDGMDVVRNIQRRQSTAPSDSDYTAGQILNEPVTIKKAYRTTSR